MSESVCGFLNLNKPEGWTSRDAVNVVQRLVRPAKAGHAGTLDPLATGVLVVAIGRATRLIEYAQRGVKRYRGEFLLGRTSNTEDIEGDIVELDNPPRPTQTEIASAAENFQGTIQQRPPAFSALKVSGKRAYQLARSGKPVELEARTVQIYELTLLTLEYPKMVLEIVCGSGTYVRSLGRDLAASLGTGAVMSSLTRLAVGPFKLKDAFEPATLSEKTWPDKLYAVDFVLADLPRLTFDETEVRRLGHGQPVAVNDGSTDRQEFAAFDVTGRFLAVVQAVRGRWKIVRNVSLGSS
ncbi:MAG: tRNA pseudouridine(55) synthase TruB [Pirellulales bacterium]|nr:tRNA pseudouridine(55) synthase TruB [Pirellulales bacterium]